jgi:L-histidine N-alpha-methyltransferase
VSATPASATLAPTVVVLLDVARDGELVTEQIRHGLGEQPRCLLPKWLYDERGAQLFDQITRLAEYYPTERERSILIEHAREIVELSGATTVVELGSGTSDKTRTLLDAFAETGQLERFVPVDVSEETLRHAAQQLAAAYPGVAVDAVVADFTQHLGELDRHRRRMVVFLGGTIGNLDTDERASFFRDLAGSLEPGDSLLLGTDLVKDIDRLIAAYDDSAGVTEAFIKNSLLVINTEFGGNFDPDAFDYVPLWDAREERMDLRLRARSGQGVRLAGADLSFDLVAGEEIRVEISTKFRIEGIAAELEAAGLRVERTWTDTDGDFAVTLALHP